MKKDLMHSFDRLPPAERAQEYLERAGVYQEFSRTASTEGAKRMFHQMALEMIERASAAAIPAKTQADESTK